MKYSDKPDSFVNAAVEVCLNPKLANAEYCEKRNEFYWSDWRYPNGENDFTHKPKDYCSNPSDAWPIILEIKRQLANQKYIWYMRRNPLREAMIVYLMMKDAENEV